jgi:diaminopimelate decarboxylase
MTTPVYLKNNTLWLESVPLTTIAEKYGTPTFVYSKQALTQAYEAMAAAFAHQPHAICYAVKANSNLAILALLAKLGAHFDIVSQGELERLLHLQVDPTRIVFSGVGKSTTELTRALEVNIGCFQVESYEELLRLQALAQPLNKIAAVAFRINPNIDVNTHPYIATGLEEHKFGIAEAEALSIYTAAKQLSHIKVIGLACHIGSQITSLEPFLAAQAKMLTLWDQLQAAGFELHYLNLGGGLGICYQQEATITAGEWITALCAGLQKRQLTLKIEPGRSLIGAAGLLLTQVEYLKHNGRKQFAIVDAGMNDVIRPALYHAWHDVVAVTTRTTPPVVYDVVGPVCETGDFLAKDRALAIATGDWLALLDAGAYGTTMSSQYNSRRLATEILVDGATTHVIRRRQTFADLYAHEQTC